MKIYHTSPDKIEKIKKYGYFDDMLFFSNTPYEMSACETILYSIEIDEDSILDIKSVFYDYDIEDEPELKKIVDDIVDTFECDEQTAIDLLDNSIDSYNADINFESGEAGWFIQTQQGHVARALGFEAAKSNDEQGTIYIVPMLGREKDLKEEK